MVQKWSKGKLKEKVNNQVLFDKVREPAPLAARPCAALPSSLPLPGPPLTPSSRCPLAAHLRQAADRGAQVQDDYPVCALR